LPLRDGSLALVVGDVSGHGLSAALFMACVRALLRTLLHTAQDPLTAFAGLNAFLCRDMPAESFMSLFVGILDPADGTIRWVSAAPTPPPPRPRGPRAPRGPRTLGAPPRPRGLHGGTADGRRRDVPGAPEDGRRPGRDYREDAGVRPAGRARAAFFALALAGAAGLAATALC